MLDTPHLVQTEPQMAAMIHITVPSDQMQEVMCPAIMEVYETVKAQGIGPTGALFAHHYGMKPGIFNFDVGVPVSTPVEPVGRVIAGELPGAVVMRTLYTGPYEGLGSAWEDFQELVKAEGRALGPNLWERYLKGPESGEDPSAYVTELNQTIIL